MQKTFIKKMLRFIALAAVLTLTIVFFMQSWILRNNMKNNAENMRVEIEKKLEQNKLEIDDITKNANLEGLVKARALASLIAYDNKILETDSSLQKIKSMLNIDGICVSDERGVLRWGTNYIGFDMNSADQSRPFMKALTDKGFELAQEPQVNGATNQVTQFIGVARQDRPGIIQIELRPERLEKALEQNKIDNVLSGFALGSSGFLIAVNQSDGVVAAHKNKAWIGKTAKEAGLPEEKEGSGFIDVDGIEMFYASGSCGEWAVYSVIPSSELYQDRNILLAVFFVAVLLIFALLVYQIKQMLHTLILSGIANLDIAVQRITAGDLDNSVEVRNTEEFGRLSDGLNKMVHSIKDEMANTERKAQETEELLVAQRELLRKVKESFEYVTRSSEEMNAISEQLMDGSGKQTEAINELAASMDQIGKAAEESAASAMEASKIAETTGMRMEENKAEMARMLDAMHEINETSAQIGHVIETVNSIAEQTNILAINASIEAARAGEAGKGFAVVAMEVGDLAAKSSEAVQETKILIGNAQKKNEMGTKILQTLAQNFNTVIEGSRQSNALMGGIGEAAAAAAGEVSDVARGVHEVSAVAEQTQAIAVQSTEISTHLLEQAKEIEHTINNYR